MRKHRFRAIFSPSFLLWYVENEENVPNKFVKNANFCYFYLHCVVYVCMYIGHTLYAHVGKHCMCHQTVRMHEYSAHINQIFETTIFSLYVRSMFIFCTNWITASIANMVGFVFEWQMILTISFRPHFSSKMKSNRDTNIKCTSKLQ